MIYVFEPWSTTPPGSWRRGNTSRRHGSWQRAPGTHPARQTRWHHVAGRSVPQILAPTYYIVSVSPLPGPSLSRSPSRRAAARCAAAAARAPARRWCRPTSRPPCLAPPTPPPLPVDVRRRRSTRPPAQGGTAALTPTACSSGWCGARGSSGVVRRRPGRPGLRRPPSRRPQTAR